jgi:hypothetical protein
VEVKEVLSYVLIGSVALQRPTLYEQIRSRFDAAFGPAHHATRHEAHWALKPHPRLAAINVLLYAEVDGAVLWVFNSHDPSLEVTKVGIASVAHADECVRDVQTRVQCAAMKRPHQPRRDN